MHNEVRTCAEILPNCFLLSAASAKEIPYLFTVALDILNIEGIQVGEGIIKLCAFADHLTTFVKNAKSLCSLQNLKTFKVSCLRLNEEKTEVYWLGSLHHSSENIGMDKINRLRYWGYSSRMISKNSRGF